MDAQGIIWEVPSQTDSSKYTVSLKRLTCECKYWREHHRVCKHIEAARLTEASTRLDRGENADLEQTPNPYKNAPHYDALKEAETSILLELVRCLGLEITNSKEIK
jgi:SWIM zinc finger